MTGYEVAEWLRSHPIVAGQHIEERKVTVLANGKILRSAHEIEIHLEEEMATRDNMLW